MRFLKKISGGALQFVVGLSILLTLMTLSFGLFVQTGQLSEIKRLNRRALFHKATEAILNPSQTPTIYEAKDVALKKTFNLTTESTLYGLFEKKKSAATDGRFSVERVALMGSQGSNEALPALYLADRNNPLYMAGKATLKGPAILPLEGVKQGNIAAAPFSGLMAVGKVTASSRNIPPISEAVRENMTTLQYKNFPDSLYLRSGSKTYFRSFLLATQLFEREDDITLAAMSFTGNIVIRSFGTIYVTPSAVLKDVVLVAPRIVIASEVTGRFQAVASEKLTVGAGSRFSYPSAFWVHHTETEEEKRAQNKEPLLSIERGVSISGVVGFSTLEQSQRKRYPQVLVAESSEIYGWVYCNGPLELRGSVKGSVYTQSFIARVDNNVYLNHLLNGSMDSSLLPKDFVGIDFQIKHPKKVMQWLY